MDFPISPPDRHVPVLGASITAILITPESRWLLRTLSNLSVFFPLSLSKWSARGLEKEDPRSALPHLPVSSVRKACQKRKKGRKKSRSPNARLIAWGWCRSSASTTLKVSSWEKTACFFYCSWYRDSRTAAGPRGFWEVRWEGKIPSISIGQQMKREYRLSEKMQL